MIVISVHNEKPPNAIITVRLQHESAFPLVQELYSEVDQLTDTHINTMCLHVQCACMCPKLQQVRKYSKYYLEYESEIL